MTLKKNLASAGVAFVTIASLTACGGDSIERPTVSEVAKVIQAKGTANELDGKVSRCIAEVIVKSKVSDDTLRKTVDSNGDYFTDAKLPVKDKKIIEGEALTKSAMKCVGPTDPTQEPPSDDPGTIREPAGELPTEPDGDVGPKDNEDFTVE